MANISAPRGLVPYKNRVNGYFTGGMNVYYVPSTYGSNIFVGDPVVPTGTSDANGIPGVQLATAGGGNYTLGPMVSIVNGPLEEPFTVTRDLPVYHPASTVGYILVADDPGWMFWIQEDSNGGAASVNASMNNANMVTGSGGSTATGFSSWQLQSSSVATTPTFQLRILRPLMEADNVAGSSYAKWLVSINLHSLTNATGV